MRKEEPKINPVRNNKVLRRENKISNGVNCLTFQKQELAIKNITASVNKARGIHEKVKLALELRKEAAVLLSCPDYKKEKLECESCRFIANLREKTALLIIRAQKLT